MNQILMRAVMQAAAFLELSSDDVLDPDVAVSQIESMVDLLGRLGDAEKDQLIGFVRAEAATTESPAVREFLRDFADAILATTP